MQFFAFWNAFIDALGLLFERFFFVSHGPFVYLPPSIPYFTNSINKEWMKPQRV